MAKKKSGTQKKKGTKKSKGGALEQLKRVKWYMWVLIALTVYFGGLYTFKYSATQHDIKLLDEAEAKMRQLDFGDATSVEYSRSCSVRSVKYGDPGRPNCSINATVIYSDVGNLDTPRHNLSGRGYSVTMNSSDSGTTYYDVKDFSRDVNCTIGETQESTLTGSPTVRIYCYKEFWKQVYPED